MNRPEHRAYLELDKAAIILESAGQTGIVDEIHNTMDLLWKLLTPEERATVNARVTVDPNSSRLGGTIHDAMQWEAFADDLSAKCATLEAGLPDNNALHVLATMAALSTSARRVAARIRGEK
jgi:hypothetical protein